MKTTVESSSASPAAQPVDPARAREQLERMLAHDVFRTSPRLQAFLRHVVERKLEGRLEELTEFAIAHEVFGRDASFDSRLDSIVRASARKLRAKLATYYDGPGAQDALRILLPTPGYVPEFVRLEAEAPASSRPRALALGVAAVVVIALAIGLSVRLARPTQPIVAVFPVRTLASNAADGPVGEALSAALIAELARSDAIAVMAPSVTAEAVRGEAVEVDFLLETLVVRSDDRFRLTAHVTDVRSQRLRWGQSFEASARDSLEAQRVLAEDVASGVVEALTEGAAPRAAGPRTVPQAYVLAKASMNRWTGPDMQRSADRFAQAIEDAPDFAPAHAGHAMALRILSFMSPNPDPDLLARARLSAERALELDPMLAEAHASLAGSEAFEHDWPSAERHFRRALELDPDHAIAHHIRGMVSLAPTGRLTEAEDELRRATELQPLSLFSHLGLVPILYFQEEYDAALDQLERARELAPGIPILHRFRGVILIAMGDLTAAVPELERAWERTDDVANLGLLAHALARTGEVDEARRLVRRMTEELDAASRSRWSLAVAYSGLGDRDAALGHLLAACEAREGWALYAAVDPIFSELRDGPDFTPIRAALRLPDA